MNCRKEHGSFPGVHCACHSPPLASFCLFPFCVLDKRVLSFLPLLLHYRLRTSQLEHIQHQQWHTLFQQQKGKCWHLIWENTGNGRGKKINGFSRRRPKTIQAAMRLSSPQNAVDTEKCQCNRCRDAQAGSAHGSLGLPGLMRVAQILWCWWHRNQLESGNDLAMFPGAGVQIQSFCF